MQEAFTANNKCQHIYRHATGKSATVVPGRLHTTGSGCPPRDRRLQSFSAPVPAKNRYTNNRPAEASPRIAE